MASNILTNLVPTLYNALDVVSRELVGFIPAVNLDASDRRAALNESILVPITTPQAPQTITPGVIPPDTGDQTVNNVSMQITNSQFVPIRWNGEQQVGMLNAGTYDRVLQQQIEQGFRSLTNAVELSCFQVAYQGASRAYGTPGSTPFGVAGDLSDAAQTRKILDDNGCPQSDLHLVLGSAAVANLRGKQSLLLKANENGSDAFRRTGALSDIPVDGFMLHNSYGVKPIVAGTGASYVTSGSTAAGVTTVALVTGTGTINAGDVITFAGDTANGGSAYKYVVTSGIGAPGTITIGAPGLMTTIASGTAVTVSAGYTPNVAFTRSAIQLIARPPATPMMGGVPMDLAEDVMLMTDPYSNLTFEVSVYRQYKAMQLQIALAWGVAAIKANNIVLLQA